MERSWEERKWIQRGDVLLFNKLILRGPSMDQEYGQLEIKFLSV